MLKSVNSLLFALRNWFGKHLLIIWNMVPTCLMWIVCQERNTCIFEDNERPLRPLKVSSLWYFVFVGSYLVLYELYFIVWFLHFLFLFALDLVVFTPCTECSLSWTWCSIFFNKSFINSIYIDTRWVQVTYGVTLKPFSKLLDLSRSNGKKKHSLILIFWLISH